MSVNLNRTGLGGTISVAFSQGAFGGFSFEGAMIGPQNAANEAFYKSKVTPMQIIGGQVTVPGGTLMHEIYQKIEKLSKGEVGEISDAERKKIETALQEANRLGEEARKSPNVHHVDSMTEAQKQALSSNQ